MYIYTFHSLKYSLYQDASPNSTLIILLFVTEQKNVSTENYCILEEKLGYESEYHLQITSSEILLIMFLFTKELDFCLPLKR